ncbi:MAG: putative quinol monooxygenase [Acidobacteriota bacterium]
MILVLGSLVARPETLDTVVELSRAHVERSRSEEGCLEHGVSVDLENPLRLVFVERWRDRDALDAHFALESSRDFVRAVHPLVAEPPSLDIFPVVAQA